MQYLAQITEVSKLPPKAAFISNLWTTFSSKEKQNKQVLIHIKVTTLTFSITRVCQRPITTTEQLFSGRE